MDKSILMTVIQYDPNNEPSLKTINVLDVDFIENEGKRIVYHIGDEKFYQISHKSELEELLQDHGFEVLDRPFLVNMSKIQYYDPVLNKVYFVPEPKKGSKFVTISRINKVFVEKFIQRIVSHNQGTTTEIKSTAPMFGIKKLLKGFGKS